MKTLMVRLWMAATMVVLLLSVSCGKNIEPQRDIYDANGEIFLENGVRVKATTQFTTDALREALLATPWVRDYAFFYDKSKAGVRSEMSFAGSYYYDFRADGTATMTNEANIREVYDYTYSIQGREVVLTADRRSDDLMMRAVALDAHRLVVDVPVAADEVPRIYDAQTTKMRMVFRPYTPH